MKRCDPLAQRMAVLHAREEHKDGEPVVLQVCDMWLRMFPEALSASFVDKSLPREE